MNCAESWVVTILAVLAVCMPAWADGTLNLGPEEFVKAGASDLVVPGYSVPCFEDWNNDLLKDLIVGEGGATPGKVRVYLNVGTESDPCFVGYSYARSAGQDLTCPAQGCMGCFPRVADWDSDGRKDLVVGLADGTVKVYLNVTVNNEPAFDGGTTVMVGSGGAWTLDVGARATPIPLQWNDDGLLDLVVGGLDGLVHVYANCGCGGGIPPSFQSSPAGGWAAQANGHDLMVPSGRSSPVIMDLDGDGKKDLLTGNTDGQILFYKNIGLDSLPDFTGYTLVQSEGKPIDLAGTPRSRPSVCTWTGDGHFGPKDGYWDLLVGSADGRIRLYRGIPKQGDFDADGDLDGDDFTFLAKALDKPLPAGGSAADLNKDGLVDVLDLRLFADLWLAANP